VVADSNGGYDGDPSAVAHRHNDRFSPDPRDSAPNTPRSVVVDSSFDWGGDTPPATAMADSITDVGWGGLRTSWPSTRGHCAWGWEDTLAPDTMTARDLQLVQRNCSCCCRIALSTNEIA
jgi:hypothetical protein